MGKSQTRLIKCYREKRKDSTWKWHVKCLTLLCYWYHNCLDYGSNASLNIYSQPETSLSRENPYTFSKIFTASQRKTCLLLFRSGLPVYSWLESCFLCQLSIAASREADNKPQAESASPSLSHTISQYLFLQSVKNKSKTETVIYLHRLLERSASVYTSSSAFYILWNIEGSSSC